MGTELAVGIDFGGTKMLGVLVDREGRRLAECRVPTPHDEKGLVAGLVRIVDELTARATVETAGLGVGAAGLVGADGKLAFGPNVGGLTNIDLRAGLRAHRSDVAIVIENDATCATWAESVAGAGKGVSEMALATLGTGIGGGLIVGGKVSPGHHRFAGEFGHMTIVVDGVECVCGKTGCWEAYASGRALGRLGREHAAAGGIRNVLEAAGAVDDIRGEHVTHVARSGDSEALGVMAEFARWVAIGASNLVAAFDPTVIVIGGGLAEDADLFLDSAQEQLDAIAFGAKDRPATPLVKASLGEYAGAIGAALLVFEEVT